jgi:hypothetical protein
MFTSKQAIFKPPKAIRYQCSCTHALPWQAWVQHTLPTCIHFACILQTVDTQHEPPNSIPNLFVP